jgi:hypothetical protein
MKVVISRYWHKPEISILVKDGISLEIGLEDYLKAVVAEMGNPTTLFTRAQLERRLLDAGRAANEKIKEASKQAV